MQWTTMIKSFIIFLCFWRVNHRSCRSYFIAYRFLLLFDCWRHIILIIFTFALLFLTFHLLKQRFVLLLYLFINYCIRHGKIKLLLLVIVVWSAILLFFTNLIYEELLRIYLGFVFIMVTLRSTKIYRSLV